MTEPSITQRDFSGGIFTGRNAPENTVRDALNALISDSRDLYKRGGTVYLSDASAQTVRGLGAVRTHAGPRIIVPTDGSHLRVLGPGETTFTSLSSVDALAAAPWTRIIGSGGYAVLRYGDSTTGHALLYAGSKKDAYAGGGTVSATNGSRSVAGAGTAFTANVDKGTLVVAAGFVGIVDKVTSNTAITLRDPWTGATGAVALQPTLATGVGDPVPSAITAAGTVPRLLFCQDSRAYLSTPGQPVGFDADVFVEIPDGGAITGAEGIGSSAHLFATTGAFLLTGLDFDPLDAAGNIQFSMSKVSSDLALWDDAGLVSWAGGLIVPAIDDVYMLGTEATPISGGIRDRYRGYVQDGHKLGPATVYHSHYILPVLDSSNDPVDALVCRLDLGRPAWTRWDGHARARAYAVQVGSAAREPVPLSIADEKVLDLSDCFTTGAASDANGTAHAFTVESRDLDLSGQRRPATAQALEAVYELTGVGVTVAASWAPGTEGASYTGLSAARGGVASDGETASVWRLAKARRALRFKLVQTGATSKMILHEIRLRLRGSGW